jgi:hypothetical protein
MALRAGTRTVIKSVSDKYDNLKERLDQNYRLRRDYLMRERYALLDEEIADEEINILDTLRSASKHRLEMHKLHLEEAMLDNSADRIVEATNMVEAAQQEYNQLEDKYADLKRDRDNARAHSQNFFEMRLAARQESFTFVTPQDYNARGNEISNLRRIVSEKRRDNNIANEFNSSVNMQ